MADTTVNATRNILHLTCMRSTKYGAIEHYIVETARRCNAYGYKTLVQYEEHPKSTIFRNELNSLGADLIVFESTKSLLQVVRQITKLIYAVRPVIIQTYFPAKSTRLVTPIIAKMRGVQKTIAVALSMEHLSKKSLIARLSYNRYDNVIAISKAIADNLIYAGINPRTVSTLYMGVFAHVQASHHLREQIRRELQIPLENKVLACIGFDTYFKGLDILLKAFQTATRDRSDTSLIIVGVDPNRSQLPALAGALGIGKRVHWAGIRDEGWQALNAARIYMSNLCGSPKDYR